MIEPSGKRQRVLFCEKKFRFPRGAYTRFFQNRRDGRVVEGARLESVFRGNSNVGSNPTLSARLESIIYRE